MRLLQEPTLELCDIDGAERLSVHRAVLERKSMLREVFLEMHRTFLELDRRFFTGGEVRVEIGAGVYPVRETDGRVFATDVIFAPHLSCVADACALPFASGRVRAVYAQNCFHHFPRPRRFFEELRRVLAVGGGAILIEPYHGAAASWLYPRLFASESFDKLAPAWELTTSGPMNGANQALSYLVFHRDRAAFEAEFPELRIVHSVPLTNHVRYLLSGGLNFRQLVPEVGVQVLRLVERLLGPLRGFLALHHATVLLRIR